MFEKLCENLNNLMQEAHISAEELARRIGLPASSIKKIRNRDNLNPTLSTLSPIAKYFCLSISQLIGDEPLPKSRKKGSYQISSEKLTHIPLISWQDAIVWPTTNSKIYPTVTSEHLYSKDAYALLIEEEGLENLPKGTILLIDPIIKPQHRDFVIVYRNDQNMPSLKQVLFDEDHVYLKSVILGYNIVPFTSEHVFLGVIMEYKKHLRKNLSETKF